MIWSLSFLKKRMVQHLSLENIDLIVCDDYEDCEEELLEVRNELYNVRRELYEVRLELAIIKNQLKI
jgi:hypothetical protein